MRTPGGAAPRAYRWAILAIGVFAQASFAAVFFGIPVIAPALRADFELTFGDLGLVLASVSVGMLLTVFPWGILADRTGEPAVMASGLAVAAIALCLAAFSRSFLARSACRSPSIMGARKRRS